MGMTGGGKVTLTPKAIIHKKFGAQASYKVEEVYTSSENDCPGLTIPQKGPCLYRCHLQLPEVSVVSDVFKKKKDAEQAAAEMALQKLGILPQKENDLTVDEAWDDLVARIKFLFSDEFISSTHPLGGHLRASLQKGRDPYSSIPISIIATFDAKVQSRCKIINHKSESNIFLVMSYIMKGAAKLSDGIVYSSQFLSLQRPNPYPSEILEAVATQFSRSPESIKIDAIRIPCMVEKAVEPVTLNLPSNGYYLDVIAQMLGLENGSQVLISRTVGKASSETRLYYAIPKLNAMDYQKECLDGEEAVCVEGSLNERASCINGEDIFGDAILASIGYTWKFPELYFDNFTLRSYYRLQLSKIPCGIYRLSREALLAAEFPLAFTAPTNWRGSLPREILSMFCRQHRLSEPVLTTSTTQDRLLSEPVKSHKKLKVSEVVESDYQNDDNTSKVNKQNLGDSRNSFSCEVKILSKSQDLMLVCSSRTLYKRQSDSVQHASLKTLSWINEYFRNSDACLENLKSVADALDVQFYPQSFPKQFFPGAGRCRSDGVFQIGDFLDSSVMNGESFINGSDSGICPSNSSLVCICYSVALVTSGEFSKQLIESNEEFEFEIGTGAVVSCLESAVTQMSVGQYACFLTRLPSEELVLAAAADSVRTRLLLATSASHLEYGVLLLGVKEPPEERMEQALFSPPLSKQRVEYAVKHIRESCASTLVDFGCGSGSLLDSLFDYPTSLETVAGVDISSKSLARAAKMLHSKLSRSSCNGVKSAVLYDGSITDFDSRLSDFDIGTCLEVIEHMEEDQACLFGDVVLSMFRPKLLIVSTPNYEYNVILQGFNSEPQEDMEERTQSQLPKFRNHDHKFEWTREQFNQWASELAKRQNYSVEFSGVGGSGDVEPGFASQIAVFRTKSSLLEKDDLNKTPGLVCPYNVIWKWARNDEAN